MALAKGKVYFLPTLMGATATMIEGNIQNVDQVGVMMNSSPNGDGVLTIYPMHRIEKIEMAAPMVGRNVLMPKGPVPPGIPRQH